MPPFRVSHVKKYPVGATAPAGYLVRVGRLELPAGRASVGRAERRMASLAPGLRPEPLGDANWRPGVLSARLKDSEASRQMAARL